MYYVRFQYEGDTSRYLVPCHTLENALACAFESHYKINAVSVVVGRDDTLQEVC